MRTPKYYLILLLLFLTTITDSCLAQQGDVFFLVDVSGSMRSTEINSEAKQIVLELMQGNFSMSDWETKGWKSVNSSGVFFNRQNNSMLLDKGIFCLMPFGNMETVRKYQMMTFNSTNNQSFGDFYQKAFPKSHNEEYTFLSLAKAYSVVLAAQKGLEGKKIWLIVYSDGMGDSMDSNNFPDDLQKAWDYFGTTSASIMQKNGVLRKTNPRKHYDIEVWTMGPIPKIIDTTTPPPPPPAPLPFKITSPQQGISVKTAIEIKKNEKFELKWSNNIGTVSATIHSVQIQKVNSGDVEKLNSISNPKDYFTKKMSVNTGSIIFHKSGLYKITLKDDKMRNDFRYVKVKGSFPFVPVLLILLAVGGGVAGYNYWRKHRETIDNPSGFPQAPTNNHNKNDDWI